MVRILKIAAKDSGTVRSEDASHSHFANISKLMRSTILKKNLILINKLHLLQLMLFQKDKQYLLKINLLYSIEKSAATKLYATYFDNQLLVSRYKIYINRF